MSPIYTPGKLTLRKTWQPMDTDAATYITAVEAADTAAGQSGGLEEKTKIAIDNFVLGCKADGIWTAIKASCILAGARTLNGALVPLAGTAPTNPFVNPANESLGRLFVSGDYNRKTGLVGNGIDKYLDTNRREDAEELNSIHTVVFVTGAFGAGQFLLYGLDGSKATGLYRDASQVRSYSRGTVISGSNLATGFAGVSRSASNLTSFRVLGSIGTSTVVSNGQNTTSNFYVFSSPSYASGFKGTGRIAFYSIGAALDLALLDARVTALIDAIGAAF